MVILTRFTIYFKKDKLFPNKIFEDAKLIYKTFEDFLKDANLRFLSAFIKILCSLETLQHKEKV